MLKVHENLDSVRLSDVVLTIGNFDGVHLGHQAIVAAARRIASGSQAPVVAMTFEPHPAAVLMPDRVPAVLTPLPEKLRCLEAAGADVVVVVPSKPEFFRMSAEAFIAEVIVERFHPVAMVEGASFRFGSHRMGDIAMLRAGGQTHGFVVEVIEPVRVDLGGHPDTVISSSLVRHLLNSGTVDRAAVCLGRPYALIGPVIRGAGRGRELGFATANLAIDRQLIPPDGVYAGRTEVDGHPVAAALSIGRAPTFEVQELLVEAHLLDYSGDLYNRTLRVEFIEWLRPQQKFDSVAALCEQMNKDVARTREIAAGALRYNH